MRKYKVSAFVRGKIRQTTLNAKNKDDAKRKAAKNGVRLMTLGIIA